MPDTEFMKGKVTMYVGLPPGKLGVNVINGVDQNNGFPTIVISSIQKKSKVQDLLYVGDTIISLNGCNVVPTKDQQSCFQSYEEEITLSSSHEEFYEEGSPEDHDFDVVKDYTEWFAQMLKQVGNIRYLCIERKVDNLLQSEIRRQRHPNAKSVQIKGTSSCLGIVVRGKGQSWLSSSRYRLGPSPLWVSRVFDTSEFSGKLFVGNEITHLNGHALLGISPDHFAEMMQDIGENEKRIMTVEQIPSEIDL